MPRQIFVTGISTEVGKTVASAIITQALEADYWKPVQAGELEYTDSDKVASWIDNPISVIHPTAYKLNTPMSPHAAADIDGVTIDLKKLHRPETTNDLVIEGAGGLMVPLTNTLMIADLIKKEDLVILVSRHYLGSINHSLLSVNELKSRGLQIAGILFIGEEHPTTESVIASYSGATIIGRIPEAPVVNKDMIATNAQMIKQALLNVI